VHSAYSMFKEANSN